MQCRLGVGYEQGWDIPAKLAGPTSPARFVRDAPSSPVKTLDVAQQAQAAEGEMSELAFSPDARYVAEWGNSASGGDAEFTWDDYTVKVYDTTTGRSVFEKTRRETQEWTAPYRKKGAIIKGVRWHHPHELFVSWSDNLVTNETFDEIKVSAFHFSSTTWAPGHA